MTMKHYNRLVQRIQTQIDNFRARKVYYREDGTNEYHRAAFDAYFHVVNQLEALLAEEEQTIAEAFDKARPRGLQK